MSSREDESKPKDWFPDHIPGIYRLSKTEAYNDVEFIQSSHMYDIKKREDQERPNKRARLNAKLTLEMKQQQMLKMNHQSVRHDLNATRADIARYRDAIGQMKRQIMIARVERGVLDERFKTLEDEFNQNVASNRQISQQYHKAFLDFKNRLQNENAATMEAMRELDDMRNLHNEIHGRDVTIQKLEEDRLSAIKQLNTLEELILRGKNQMPSLESVDVSVNQAKTLDESGMATSSSSLSTASMSSSTAASLKSELGTSENSSGLDDNTSLTTSQNVEKDTNMASSSTPSSSASSATTTATFASSSSSSSSSPSTSSLSSSTSALSSDSSKTPADTKENESSITLPEASKDEMMKQALDASQLTTSSLPPLIAEWGISLVQQHATEVATLQDHVREMDMKVRELEEQLVIRGHRVDLMGKELEVLQQDVLESKRAVRVQEKLTALEKQKFEEARLLADKVGREALRLTGEVERREELLKLYRESSSGPLDAVQRQAEAMLMAALCETRVLRAGNQVLQASYNQIMEERKRLLQEKTALMDELMLVSSGGGIGSSCHSPKLSAPFSLPPPSSPISSVATSSSSAVSVVLPALQPTTSLTLVLPQSSQSTSPPSSSSSSSQLTQSIGPLHSPTSDALASPSHDVSRINRLTTLLQIIYTELGSSDEGRKALRRELKRSLQIAGTGKSRDGVVNEANSNAMDDDD